MKAGLSPMCPPVHAEKKNGYLVWRSAFRLGGFKVLNSERLGCIWWLSSDWAQAAVLQTRNRSVWHQSQLSVNAFCKRWCVHRCMSGAQRGRHLKLAATLKVVLRGIKQWLVIYVFFEVLTKTKKAAAAPDAHVFIN